MIAAGTSSGLTVRATVANLLQRASGPQAAVRALLGESALWWKCCSEAVCDDPAWLADRSCEELRGWLTATASDQDASASARTDHPFLLAKALVAPQGQAGGHDASLLRLIRAWEGSGLLCSEIASGLTEPSGKGLAELSPCLARGLNSVLQRIRQLRASADLGEQPSPAERMAVVAALLMACVKPRKRPVVRVSVVFGRSSGSNEVGAVAEGVNGTLELREFPPGPAGLYPDPRTMTGMRSPNSQFADALGEAWQLAGHRREGRCVLWRIVLSDESAPPAWIEGPSLGAAFALGLRGLLRYPPSHLTGVAWIRDLVHGFRARTAVTGALDAESRMLRVAGMDAKLLAARRKRLRLVAPEANRLDVAAAPDRGEVRFAATLGEADRYARQFRTGRLAVAALVLAAATITFFAFQQRDLADARQREALIDRVAAQADQLRDTDPSLAARLDIIAYRLNPTDTRYTRLVANANLPLSTVLNDYSGGVHALAFSPDGRTLAAVGYDNGVEGTLRLWDTTDPKHPHPIGRPLRSLSGVGSVAFSPDGRILATAGYSTRDAVRLWNVTDPAHPRALGRPLRHTPFGSVAFGPSGRILATGSVSVNDEQLWDVTDPVHPIPLGQPLHHRAAVNEVAFSPGGRVLATFAPGNGVRLWNIADAAHPKPLAQVPIDPSEGVSSLVFSPDGRVLATGEDGSVRLWNVSDPTHPVVLGGPKSGSSGEIRSMAFSPDGRILVFADGEYAVRLWDVVDPAHPTSIFQPLAGHTSGIYSVAFSPDGQTFATAGNDHTVRLWHLPSALLTDHAGPVVSTAFASDGRIMATASTDRTVRLWNVADPSHPAAIGRIQGLTYSVGSMALSPDGRILATTMLYSDREVQLWNLTDPAHPTSLVRIVNFAAGVSSVAFSPDGQILATATSTAIVGGDESVRLWDMSNPSRPRQRGRPLTGHASAVSSVAFSPDGRTLATAGSYAADTVRLWEVTDPDHPALIGEPLAGGARSMVFSPDGRTLATITTSAYAGTVGDGTVKLWNIADRAHPAPLGRPLNNYTSSVNAVAFSPDGHTLVTAGTGVRLWNVDDPAHPAAIGRPLEIHTAEVASLSFAPAGRTLAVGGYDHTVRLWQLGADQAIRQICARTDAPTRQQWQQYLSAFPYRSTCG